MAPRRIVIVGTSGSGKSTLAERISEKLNIPIVELDALFWKDNWTNLNDKEFLNRVEQSVAPSSWVLTGNYSKARKIIWSRADTLIWLDYSYAHTFKQILSRSIKRAWTKEPLWGTNCTESFRRSFFSKESVILWMMTSYRDNKLEYNRVFSQRPFDNLSYLRFTNPQDTEKWLQNLNKNGPSERDDGAK